MSATPEKTADTATDRPPRHARSRVRWWVLVIAAVVVATGIWIGVRGPAPVEPGTFVVLDLESGLPERAPGSIEQLFGASPVDALRLHEVLESTLSDDRVDGVLIRLASGEIGGGLVEEIGARLEDVRNAGKRVVAFTSGADTLNYLLATAADEIVQDAATQLNTTGLRLTTYFFKDLLEKYGAKADFVRVGKYKGAFEQVALSGPTEETARAMDELADSLYAEVVGKIARGRGLEEAQVRSLVDRSPLTAREALDEKLVDAVMFSDELEPHLKSLLHERDAERELHLLSVEEYAERTVERGTGPHLAVVHVAGTIIEGESRKLTIAGEACGASTVVAALRKAAGRADVKGILLRVDSPGGLVSASERIWRAVDEAARKKPLVASLGNTAASGGYYAACAADKVLAHGLTLTGSVGVFGGKLVLGDLLASQGVNVRTYARGRHATMFDFDRPFQPEERLQLERMLETSYTKFLQRINAKRAVPAGQVDSVAQGRVWSGRQAREIGLVDGLGGLPEAVAELRRLAGVPDTEALGLRAYPEAPTLWDLFTDSGRRELTRAGFESHGPVDLLRAWVRESGFFESPAGLALMPWAVRVR